MGGSERTAEDGPPDDPDVALMLRVQAGDEGAFRLLVERNGRRVLSLAYRYLGERSAAEDVVQETFLKLYQARDRYRPDARFGSYLLRIASNLCVSKLRKRRPLSLSAGDDDEGRGAEPEDERARAPDDALARDELHAKVRAAVAQLPERQRLAILLNKFEGLDYKEVGEQLGLTVPATKSLLHRARMALKDVLAGDVEPEEEEGQ